MNDNAPDWAKKLSNIEDRDQLLKHVEEILPDWISHFISSYSDDYNFLSKNWEFICNDLKISPQKILLVKFLPSNKDSTDFLKINFVSDILTRKGYIIRRNTEFITCKYCNKAIPSLDLYNMMIEKCPQQIIDVIPKTYSEVCSNCQ